LILDKARRPVVPALAWRPGGIPRPPSPHGQARLRPPAEGGRRAYPGRPCGPKL